MDKERYLTKCIIKDLTEKMVFIGGARQVGKTTMAQKLVAPSYNNSAYFNWDYRPDRQKLLQGEFPGDANLLIFDEIHKYKKWKTLVKGVYDTLKEKYRFLITGSARLNIYRKGGDSLQGRYHYFTLHPFSMAEMLGITNHIKPFDEISIYPNNCFNDLEILEHFGGFPEVLIKQNDRTLRRWHHEKLERLFKEDIRDIEAIRDIGTMQLLGDLLPHKVGSLLSINSIREDIEVSHRAATSWLSILEMFYYHFRIYPHQSNIIRSIKKEPKLYLIDWSEVPDESARFENLVGSHLLKLIQYMQEYEGYSAQLNFLRNVDKKEVDFLVSIDNKPWFCVEAKQTDTTPSSNLYYYRERLQIPYVYQVVKKEKVDIFKNNVRIISADRFLASLF
jgi:predicted AAA+ superfamily ATPase